MNYLMIQLKDTKEKRLAPVEEAYRLVREGKAVFAEYERAVSTAVEFRA